MKITLSDKTQKSITIDGLRYDYKRIIKDLCKTPNKAGNYWPLAEPDTRAAPDAIKAAMLIGTYGHSNCHRVLSVVSCWWMRG